MNDNKYNKAAVQYAEKYLDQLLKWTDFGERAGIQPDTPPPKKAGRRKTKKK